MDYVSVTWGGVHLHSQIHLPQADMLCPIGANRILSELKGLEFSNKTLGKRKIDFPKTAICRTLQARTTNPKVPDTLTSAMPAPLSVLRSHFDGFQYSATPAPKHFGVL